jgi:hypothetical protein
VALDLHRVYAVISALTLAACGASGRSDPTDAGAVLDGGAIETPSDAGSWPPICAQPGYACVSCSGALSSSLLCAGTSSLSTRDVSAVEATDHPDPVPVDASDVFVIGGCDLQVTNEGSAIWGIVSPSCAQWTLPGGESVSDLQINSGSTLGYDGLKRTLSISGTATQAMADGGVVACSVMEQGDLYCL